MDSQFLILFQEEHAVYSYQVPTCKTDFGVVIFVTVPCRPPQSKTDFLSANDTYKPSKHCAPDKT